METITKFLSLFTISLIIFVHQTNGAGELKGKELMDQVCEQTPHKDLCIQVLQSDPTSAFGNLQDLAMISLRVAAANASGILSEVKIMIDDVSLDPAVQQGLSDCKENLLDAEGQLEDTVAAILTESKHDANLWLKAALAAIDTCEASIPGNEDVLSVKSVEFRKLCNIAVAISRASLAQHA
ncbi:hypothetical protein RIF29_22405 [Crotalaria pallida]|uniref:Pectinesterase inhibitor domain-containing protein n=1 Tax=Crotalaria pallida TaxID=3830 RepID=A0AAN9F8S7_CROPI